MTVNSGELRAPSRGICQRYWTLVQWLLLLLVLVCLTGPGPGVRRAWAGHGGVVQLNRASAGPYALSVWTQPAPPTAGRWQVDVAVMRETGMPVSDAVVRVRAEPLSGTAPPVETDARRDADPLGVRYRASLTLGTAGPWRVSVFVAGPSGPGALTFPVDVEPASRGGWLGVALGIAGLATLGAVIVARRRRLAVAALGLVLLATPAWPHASLVRSSPARRATLGPRSRTASSSGSTSGFEPAFSGRERVELGGHPGGCGGRSRGAWTSAKRLSVTLPPLAARRLRSVRYRVLSVDGHVVASDVAPSPCARSGPG